ncbi:MAG: diguanylate cyclase (GGDEF)-like protein [Acidimicrobiales bacterium]
MTLVTPKYEHRPEGLADFRVKTTLWVAIAGVLFLAPFSINNMFQGQILLGLGATMIVVVLALLAGLAYKGHFSNLALMLFPPVLWFLLLSVKEQGMVGVMWSYPSIICFYFIFRERWAWVANAILIMTVVPMASAELETAVALQAMVTLTVVSILSVMAVRVIRVQQQCLETMAVTDSLTGLLNRRLLRPSLEQALARQRRSDEPAILLMVDVDYFKNINDTFGHLTGDHVLAGLAKVLKGRLRATDQIFRVGGEEFAIILPNTASGPGHLVAQLLRSAVAGENLIDSHPVTISVGAAKLDKADTPETWVARADQCLYNAKSDGRNRVVADTPLQPA